MTDHNALGEKSIFKLMLRYSLPCILSLLIGAIYNTVDQIFIGNSELSTLGNAATGAVFPIFILGQAFAWCLGNGCSTYLNICQGKKDTKSVNKTIGTGISVALILSLLVMAIVFPFKRQILGLFGATADNMEYAVTYLNWILAFFPTFVFSNMLMTVVSADGSPIFSMITMLAGAIINTILDPIFIFVCHMGMTGAALATVCGQIVSCIILIIYFSRPKTFKLNLKSFIPDFKELWRIVRLGSSTLVTQLTLLVVTVLTNSMLVKYGALSEFGVNIPIAVFGIVSKVFAIMINFVVGIVLGSQPIISYNMGAGKYDRIRKLYFSILGSALFIGIIATIIFQVIPDKVIKLFGTPSNIPNPEDYWTFAKMTFRIYLMLVSLLCVVKINAIFLQSTGNSAFALVTSVIRDLVCFVPLICLLPLKLGIKGILIAAPISDFVAFSVSIIFIILFFKKIKKFEIEAQNKLVSNEEKSEA